jgi:F-box and WD-40 domain protein CDC4
MLILISIYRENIHTLYGNTSMVRYLTLVNETAAVSGSRDTTLRVWNIRGGLCTNVLSGRRDSVRCVVATGDLIMSGSYDTTARVSTVSDGV